MTLQVLSLIAVVATVLVLAWQSKEVATATRLASRTAVTTAMSDVTAHLREVLQALIAHPELRPFVNEGQPLPAAGSDRARAQTLCELLCDALEATLEVASQIPAAGRAMGGWTDYARTVLGTSPGCRDHVAGHPTWYPRMAVVDRTRSTAQP